MVVDPAVRTDGVTDEHEIDVNAADGGMPCAPISGAEAALTGLSSLTISPGPAMDPGPDTDTGAASPDDTALPCRPATSDLRHALAARRSLVLMAAVALAAVIATTATWLGTSNGVGHRLAEPPTRQHPPTSAATSSPLTTGQAARNGLSSPGATTQRPSPSPSSGPPASPSIGPGATSPAPSANQPTSQVTTHTSSPSTSDSHPPNLKTTQSPKPTSSHAVTTFSISVSGATQYSCGTQVSSASGGASAQFTFTNNSSAVIEIFYFVGSYPYFQADLEPGEILTVSIYADQYWMVQDPRGCLAILNTNGTGHATVN